MSPEIVVTVELRDPAATARAGLRGLVAAMAMTGIRTFTANVGLLEESPPEAIMEEHRPNVLRHLSDERRTAVTELVHWAYGTAGGAFFSLLPGRMRAHPLTGPAYGLAVWLAFELGLAPLLGLRHARAQRPISRAVLALDHILYGIVVSGRLAPEPGVPHPGDHIPARAPRARRHMVSPGAGAVPADPGRD